uniref:CAZy families CE4 protein n=1 Tax=uncultured Kribbella sp. TaxID=304889 RepID=A0A060CB98_9ACTN|nr:CAZy families CE4 protein [uncultured Kribbella sp.]
MLTAKQLKWQLRNGPKAKCFRPPYGATNATVQKAIKKAGMRQVLWSIDTLDWTRPGTAKLAKTGRLKAVQNGSIILMHDGGGDRSQTLAALPQLIHDLKARGFTVRALPYC